MEVMLLKINAICTSLLAKSKLFAFSKNFFTTHMLYPLNWNAGRFFCYLLGSRNQEWILNCTLKLMSCQSHFFLMSHWNSAQRDTTDLMSAT